MSDDEQIDWEAFGESPAAIEQQRIDAGDFWCTSSVAGLQYYAYDEPDGLGGVVRPVAGDRLSLMRRPENPADGNAVEIWWRNEYHIGHLPRGVAAIVAGPMDRGASLRGYVFDGGSGEAWSAKILLVGQAVERMHAQRHDGWVRREVADGTEAVWGVLPTARQRQSADLFDDEVRARRTAREADAIYGFHLMPVERAALPDDVAVDETQRGKIYKWWDDVPGWLRTKTQLKALFLKPIKGGRPFAAIQYIARGDLKRFDLWSVAEAVPVRQVAPEVGARAAEAMFWRRPEIEAARAQREKEYWEACDRKQSARRDRDRSWSEYG
jgi:hypothetical protein